MNVTRLKRPFCLWLLLWGGIFTGYVQAQVASCLTVANEHADSGFYHFDIYLTTTTGSTGDLYLGSSDFRIKYTAASFAAPVLSVVDGYCTLVPTTAGAGGINTIVLQATYHTGTATSITSDEWVINAPDRTPSTASFDATIAKIDGTVLTHRLGRFKVSGYNGGTAGLSWNTTESLRTKVFSFDPVTLISSETTITTGCTALPVEGTLIAANILNPTTIKVEWVTQYENNSDYFQVEKRHYNGSFMAIGNVKSAGTSTTQQAYYFIDQTPMTPVMHYRLKQVDLNGTFTYSDIVEVHMDEMLDIQVYPNPASEIISISLEGNHPHPLIFRLYDLSGRQMKEVLFKANGVPVRIDISALSAGVYLYNVAGYTHPMGGRILKN